MPVGTSVEYEFDVEPLDRFGRSLVYLYKTDGTFVNGDLVRDGFARAKAYPPNIRYEAKFASLEKQAQAEQRGLWGACEDARASSSKGFDPGRSTRAPAISANDNAPLANPGNTKNCDSFETYAEAKAWYDLYFPQFGDVARLDANGDGRPCESLMRR